MSSRVRRKLAVVLVTLVVALAAVDVGITVLVFEDGGFRGRPLPPFGALPHPKQRVWLEAQLALLEQGDPPPSQGLFDTELGWTNRPSSSSEDGRFRFNSLGARGAREYEPDQRDGKRLLCFGDSYTYGSEVPDGEDWPAQLQDEASQLEVVNFGVGGYGTDQALLRFRRRAPGLYPDAVAVGLLLENIGRNVNRYRPLYYPNSGAAGAKPRFVVDKGGLHLVPLPFESRREYVEAVADGSVVEQLSEHEFWADVGLGPLRWSSFARLALGWREYARRQTPALWSDVDGQPFRVTLALLEAFVEEATQAGASQVVVLVFPREKEMDARLAGNLFWSPLLEALSERSIEFIDVSELLEEPYADAAPLYRGGHLNAEGNAIVAKAVHDWLGQ